MIFLEPREDTEKQQTPSEGFRPAAFFALVAFAVPIKNYVSLPQTE